MRHRRRSPGLRRASLHFMVIADYTLTRGRPSLVGLSLHSTKESCTPWPVSGSQFKSTCNKWVFSTLKEARSYIGYLKERHPTSTVLFPVLDKGQQDFFIGVSDEKKGIK